MRKPKRGCRFDSLFFRFLPEGRLRYKERRNFWKYLYYGGQKSV